MIGSLTASKVRARIGPGTSLLTVLVAGGLSLAITGITSNPVVVWIVFVVFSFTALLWNVITVSLRQTIIPDPLLGRVNSVYRFFGWGMIPIGSLLGGAIVAVTEVLGNRTLALRMPFLVAGGVNLLLFFYALPNLSTHQIEAAKAAVEPDAGLNPPGAPEH